MRIAFHAPLKPPDHPVPSGDRAMARALLGLLADLGHGIVPTGRFRSFDRSGDAARQERLAALGERLAARLVRRIAAGLLPRPEAWLTYHCHHKAPDHLGPRVAAALSIPYLVVEGSVSARQARGPWAVGHAASLAALKRADLVLAMTGRDRAGLLAAGLPEASILAFPPFLDAAPYRTAAAGRPVHRTSLAAELGIDPTHPWLLAIAMMRADVKQRSYAILAEAMAALANRSWQLLVAGDGPARPAVEAALRAAAGGRVRFLGALSAEALPAVYAACDLFVWPAVGEAYGMALLEAQAAGLPVVAGAEGGVGEIVLDGQTGLLVAGGEPAAFAAAITGLLDAPERRRRLGEAALAKVRAHHDRPVAGARLAEALRRARARHAQRPREAAAG